jgi:hypothetical protein
MTVLLASTVALAGVGAPAVASATTDRGHPSGDDALSAVGPTLAQVRIFAKQQGDALWPGYGEAPFGMLLLTSQRELLLCQPAGDRWPSAAPFVDVGIDRATGCAVQERPRTQLPDRLLAAFPLLSTTETIVMGTPQTTGLSPGAWTRTILHEHFHQWQSSRPGYYERTAALGLSKGHPNDWPIAYEFPYDVKAVDVAYARASQALARALAMRGTPTFSQAVAEYATARASLVASVDEQDWRYFDFQLWQEGIARWTETELGSRYTDPEVRSAAAELARRTLEQLNHPDLAQDRRTVVYPFGAGEAMLMEACHSDWKQHYANGTALTPLVDPALRNCRP